MSSQVTSYNPINTSQTTSRNDRDLPKSVKTFTALKKELEKQVQRNKKLGEKINSTRKSLESGVRSRTAALLKANASQGKEIAERKKAELALQQSEKKYSTLVEKSGDGIVIIQKGSLKFVNTGITKITGFKKETQYTLGISKYVVGHNLKFQSDFSLLEEEGNDDPELMLRMQVELAF